jgi:hypothetical protein
VDRRRDTLLAAADAAAGPDPASPLFPFVGAIQDVAIYKIALDPVTIATQFDNGNGTDP